jgi:uncharacterized C2H2 Zn-finger protein
LKEKDELSFLFLLNISYLPIIKLMRKQGETKMKQKQIRCKRCGNEIDSKDYAEHLVKYHRDFSLIKK